MELKHLHESPVKRPPSRSSQRPHAPAVSGSPVDVFLREHPRIEIVLLQNIALGLCQKLREVTREISVFDC